MDYIMLIGTGAILIFAIAVGYGLSPNKKKWSGLEWQTKTKKEFIEL